MTERTCRLGVRLLAEYVDGVLPRHARLSLERHVGICRRCRGFVRSYAATPRILRTATQSHMPAAVRRSLRARLERERSARRRSPAARR
jgi:anti-sigma factor RsiW